MQRRPTDYDGHGGRWGFTARYHTCRNEEVTNGRKPFAAPA